MMRKRSATLGVMGFSLWFGFMGCSSSNAGPRGGAHEAGMAGAAGRSADAGRGPGGSEAGGDSGGALSISGGAGGGGSGALVAGNANAGAASGSAGASNAAGGSGTSDACDRPGLVWKTANKTNYTSYPEPGSDECVKFSGCLYEGLFAACEQKRSLEWVKSHNIVAAFPDLKTLELHDLCLKSGTKQIIVTVYDTCGDSDCDGCCTKNKGNQDELIDIESFTDARWGVPDGRIEWADLGPTQGSGCN
ncbi:MAG TPA: hypothetical protein VHM25_13260 [Polyangiaceae bacterium]|jgi:hypothetical protein|nr:hypothetical protein [Polyangiaceae bacterium]